MKQAVLPVLLTILLLTGCGAGAEARIKQNQTELAAAERLCFTADVTENLQTEVFRCTLDVEAAADGTAITVTAPDSAIARAISRYFVPLFEALNFIAVGSRIAHALPWGMS